jgi:hypothetical protein
MIRPLVATFLSLCAAGAANAQAELSCPSEEVAREQFTSRVLSQYPNYSEGGGARVQHQYPSTHLFGQAKHIAREGRGAVGLCQYSNHVGLVVTFAVPIEGTIEPLHGCDSAECRSKPWWRTEYMESDPADEKLMQVCVIDRNDETFPSSDCRFKTKSAQ